VYLLTGTDADTTLVGRCLQGDTGAFRPLVEKYEAPLFRLGMRMLGNREDASDATQNAFVKAFQALDTYDSHHRFFSWLYRIALNECLNVLRARRSERVLDDSFPDDRRERDPVEAAEARRRLRVAILQLTKEQREVIVLRHFGELTYAELADSLGVPVTTVKCRLYAARQRLAELLAGEAV
jgi:RNA polymerase sigma-70 factor (ECF subfamily)